MPFTKLRRKFVQCAVLAISLILLFYALDVDALSKLADQRNASFTQLGTEDGLSQATVTAITQDNQGFIWIGTQEGLNRYDGYSFETFFHSSDDPGSISRNYIKDVLSDSEGTVWVATDYGLNRFNESSKTFETILFDGGSDPQATAHNAVKVLFEDSQKRLWIGTDYGLILRFKNGETRHFHHDPAQPDSLGEGQVWVIYEDSKGRFWVGTDKSGLHSLDLENGSFTHYLHSRADGSSIGEDHVRAILEDEVGRIWVATHDETVSILDTTTGEFTDLASLTDYGISEGRRLLKDQNNGIWIGSESGLHLYNKDKLDSFIHEPTDPNSLGDNNITDLFQDRGGVLWVGTFNGISKWHASVETFPHFMRWGSQEASWASKLISSFAETPDKNVWIGTYNGLVKWDAEQGKFIQFDNDELELTSNKIMSLGVQADTLWVGSMRGGTNLIRDNKVEAVFFHDEYDPNSISSNTVSRVLEDSKGNIWFATYGGGVNKYLGEGKFKRYPDNLNPDGIFPDLRTVDIIEASDGSMWIATDGGGVVILDPDSGNITNFRYDPNNRNTLSSNNIFSLLATVDGIWVGTRDSGLNFIDSQNGKITRIGRSNGLASDQVWGLLEDESGRIWISGGKGISVYEPKTKSFVLYDWTDGLQSDDFNSGAYLELSDGSFLFGGNNGFNAFYPRPIHGNLHVPAIKITRFSKFNETVDLPEPIYKTNQLELAYNDSVIGFEFAAMDFSAPDKNQFRYMLQGFDRDWVDANGAHQVTYTNLDAGSYEFKVAGSNDDGVWNEEGASIKLIVNPPMWATWWAYLAYLMIGLSVLYQVQKVNEMRLRREAEKRYSERLQLYIESLEEATDCVLIADANKHLMYANDAIKSILGISPPQAVGRSILSLLFSEASDASLARAGLRREGRWHGEVSARKGSEYGTTEVTIAAVHDDSDNETAYVSIARDVTDRKKVEAELEKHRQNLEQIVGERTEALEYEISENKAVQRELADSLKEKELLLKEVHHRVKNNMQVISSLLNIQAESIGDDVFSGLLGESQQRIKSMALIHENLYQSENLLEIDFKDYINMLANSLHRFYSVRGMIVSLDIQVDNVALDIETAVPCGLIINELISNSLKHAFKGKEGKGTICVKFNLIGCRYVLEISDDGIGLPVGFSLESSNSMGMEIVSILTQQLDGRLRFDSVDGASFEISFPRKEKDVNEVAISR